jgi:hypothetical protein
MANEPQKPGGPPGIEAVLRDKFKVSAKPSIGRKEAEQRILEKIAEQGQRYERIDLSDQPVRRGALFNAAGARVPFPEDRAYDRVFIALLDPEPATRWAHAAYWAFVPAEGDAEVVLQPTDLPEHATGPVRLIPLLLKP